MERNVSNSMQAGDWVPAQGADGDRAKRPGVPPEQNVRRVGHAHWTTPERMAPASGVLKGANVPAMTPVFGTAQRPHGLSGLLRRVAYTMPEHQARHWLALLLADRVDVVESSVARVVRRGWPALIPVAAAFVGLAIVRRR